MPSLSFTLTHTHTRSKTLLDMLFKNPAPTHAPINIKPSKTSHPSGTFIGKEILLPSAYSEYFLSLYTDRRTENT